MCYESLCRVGLCRVGLCSVGLHKYNSEKKYKNIIVKRTLKNIIMKRNIIVETNLNTFETHGLPLSKLITFIRCD